MNSVIPWLNSFSVGWSTVVFHSVWQSALVGVAALVAVYWGRRWPAPVRYGLLLLALVKFAMPPLWPVSTGVFGLAGPAVRTAMAQPIQTHLTTSADLVPSAVVADESFRQSVPLTEADGHSRILRTGAAPLKARNAPAQTVSLTAWLMLLHFAGTGLILLWIGGQMVRLHRLAKQGQLPRNESLQRSWMALAARLGIKRLPRLMTVPAACSPMAIGVLQPTILLPQVVEARLAAPELEAILGHELAHVRRGDLWVNWLQLCLWAVWWFHPVLWLVNRALRKTREDCCDDLLLARGLTSASDYCGALVQAARQLLPQPAATDKLGCAERFHPLGQRVARLMDRRIPRWARLPTVGLCGVAVMAVLLLPGLRSQELRPAPDARTTALPSKATKTQALPMPDAAKASDQPIGAPRSEAVNGRPAPLELLNAVAQARHEISSGEIEFDATFVNLQPLPYTNSVRISAVFDGQNRRFEQWGREYSCVLVGPDGAAANEAKIRELGLDQEGAVRAGLLKGFESHYVTAYDRARVLMYWSGNGDTVIEDPARGSSVYLFDPRVLGLTPFMSVTDTIENCLHLQNAESIELAGQETVEGVATWHLRLLPGKVRWKYHVWIDRARPFRVMKCVSNTDTVVSKYDPLNPNDPMPIEVTRSSYDGDRLRFEQRLVRRKVRFNVPIDPVCWTLAGLKMPVNTPVADIRIHRRIGYWDGAGLSENPQWSAPAGTEKPQERSTPRQLLALAQKDPKSPFAQQAAIWVMLNTPDGPDVEKAAAIIEREHVRSTNLVDLCEGLERLRHPSALPLLRALIEKNPDPAVRAHACFTLATLLKDEAKNDAGGQANQEAAQLFERVVADYGRIAGGAALAERAKSEAFELRRLGVGRVAPEIIGADLNGRKMKLSDYHGKVVVLNFWGTTCGPCMAMVPDERKLVAQWAGKRFALIGVNDDDDLVKLKAVMEQKGITWPSFRDGSMGPIAQAWNVRSWPTVYVLDAQGVIRYRNVRGQALFDAVEKLMGGEKMAR